MWVLIVLIYYGGDIHEWAQPYFLGGVRCWSAQIGYHLCKAQFGTQKPFVYNL